MADPTRYWLQLGRDADTEIFIFWQRPSSDGTSEQVEYRKVGSASWQSAGSTSVVHPHTSGGSERRVHKLHLSGLDAGAEYEWRWNGGSTRYFRLFPDSIDDRDVVIAASHDALHDIAHVNQMLVHITATDPDAFMLTGDWAYADGVGGNLWKWDLLWDSFVSYLELSDGRVIPFIPGIGNHEVTGGYSSDKSDAPYFYAFFDFPDNHAGAYQEHKAGDWFSCVVLDTQHSSPRWSEVSPHPQLQWLQGAVTASIGKLHRIATFHVPYYPSNRNYNSGGQVAGRQFVAPILEGGGIRTAFVGHDHLYSRTVRIKNEAPSNDGVKYFGDGCFGVGVRGATNAGEWWIEQAYSDSVRGRHLHRIVLSPSEIRVDSIGSNGVTFHTFTEQVGEPQPVSGSVLHPEPESLVLYPEGHLNGTPQPDDAPTMAPTVTLTPASQTALNLSLSEVDAATGYRYRVGTSGSWTDLGSGRTAQITSLTPGTSYTVQARAYNSAGDGPIGSATASTLEPEVNAPPVFQTSPPTSVRAGQVYVYNGVVTDADGDPITVTLEEGPDWLELTDHGDGTFTLEGTAPNE